MAPRRVPREPREPAPSGGATTTTVPRPTTTTVPPVTTTTVRPAAPPAGGTDVAAAVAALVAANPALASLFTNERKISALGVPGSLVVDVNTGNVIRYEGFLAIDPATGQQSLQPKYFDNDQFAVVGSYGEPQRTILAKRLQTAGVLSKSWRTGDPLSDVANALGKVMYQANFTGSTWDQQLAFYEKNPIGDSSGALKSYRVSNAMTLKETFRNVAAQTLGRRDLPEEMLQNMVTSYQQQEEQYQRRIAGGGVAAEAPSAQVFAEKQIEKRNPDEAMAFRFAEYAQAFEKALMG